MSGTKFFSNFPKVNYRFGDNELPVQFQDLSVYIDMFDQSKGRFDYYQSYYIQENQRPDQLSYELYGTTDYYWTLFLNNEKLRINGWPLENSDIYPQAQIYYPNKVLTINGVSLSPKFGLRSFFLSESFVVGSFVYVPAGNLISKIIKIDNNLGAIYLDSTYVTAGNTLGSFSRGDPIISISAADAELLKTDPSHEPKILDQTTTERCYEGWDAIHHYENSSGEWVYPEYAPTSPHQFDWNSVNTMQSVSYYQRLVEQNEDMRDISVIRPDSIIKLVSDFNSLLKRGR